MAEQSEKARILVKLFACFPSQAALPKSQTAATLAAYLETLSGISPAVLSVACSRASKSNSPFPPSAGELYERCEQIRAEQARRISEGLPRIPFIRPIDRLTPDDAAAAKARVEALARNWRRDANTEAAE